MIENTPNRPWWQTGVIYQIYPRSFADGNGDGVGDLRGIIDHSDYLTSLGIDAIWLSPVFASPMADFGYDISDYRRIDPLFGTEADFDELLSKTHQKGIRVILDLVPNHTSDEHPWFVESRSDHSSPKRDWYIWRDAGPDGPPNNWESFFGGPAWEWDETTGQYYLHLFHRKQPDLNWRNPEVRAAMYDVMRFWLDRGVDGFRIDVLWLLIKDEDFPDNPDESPLTSPELVYGRFRPGFEDRPRVQEIVTEMRQVADEYDERVLIGEIYLPIDRLVRYYGEDLDGIHLPFNFGLVTLPEWGATQIRDYIEAYEGALPPGAWPNWVLGNHDQPRIVTRLGAEKSRAAQMLLLTLRGTPTCYYGDEIGMHDGHISAGATVDPQARAGRPRDAARTPMQWDDSANTGFASPNATPWLPVDPSHTTLNVAAQETDATSPLSLFRRLLKLRREHPALATGSIHIVDTVDDDVLAYVREDNAERILVVIHLGSTALVLDLDEIGGEGQVLCSTGMGPIGPVDLTDLRLRPGEGLVIQLAD
jgi:alpha-glucosidase